MNKEEFYNPLAEPQREKSGAETYEKYAYQYHWALYRIIVEHELAREYAVFVEYHEDVVISNSLDAESAQFEFNQVKTNDKKFNCKTLLSKKNGKSILGKLLSSSQNAAFKGRISSFNLIALNGFNFELKKNQLDLKRIQLNDLADKQCEAIEKAIKEELKLSDMPINIQFIIPDLSERNFQNDVIASIAKLVTRLYPNSYCNSVEIYRLLIDELNLKGRVRYDFLKWQDFLNEKALTSITVSKVINQFTNIKDEEKIQGLLNQILKELGLNTIQSTNLRRAINRYRQLRISNNSTIQIDTTKSIINLIHFNLAKGIEDLPLLVCNICDAVPQKIREYFVGEEELKGAIICEYILMTLN